MLPAYSFACEFIACILQKKKKKNKNFASGWAQTTKIYDVSMYLQLLFLLTLRMQQFYKVQK